MAEVSGEDFIKISEIIKPMMLSGVADTPPKFVIVMGGVGSGKTTIRHNEFADGFVHFEFGEIYTAVKKVFGEDNTQLATLAAMTSTFVLGQCIESKKNIVIEIIGDDKEVVTPVIDAMNNLGYSTSLKFISCDPKEAYGRHLKAVDEDADYLSAYFTQEATLSFFYQVLDLGEMPKKGPSS